MMMKLEVRELLVNTIRRVTAVTSYLRIVLVVTLASSYRPIARSVYGVGDIITTTIYIYKYTYYYHTYIQACIHTQAHFYLQSAHFAF